MSGLGRFTPSYRAVFYCSSRGVAHFVTTREDIDSPSVKGDDQAVRFDQSEITLDIPADGVVLESGWSITPLATSELTDEHIQERVACFALSVKWNKPEEHPVELRHRIKLLGAKPPGNFITLKIEPPSQPSLEVPGRRAVKKKKLDSDEPATPTSTQPAEHKGQQENERGGQRSKRRQRCGECIGCQPIQKEDCGECPACKDMPRFGGTGRRHQPCMYHECQWLKYTPNNPSKLPDPVQGQCGKCIGCIYNNFKKKDCGQCDACKTKKKFGGEGKVHKTCRYHECQKQKYTPKKPPKAPNPEEGIPQAKIIAGEEAPQPKENPTAEKGALLPKETPTAEKGALPPKENPTAEKGALPPKKNPTAEKGALPPKENPTAKKGALPPKENPTAENRPPPSKRKHPTTKYQNKLTASSLERPQVEPIQKPELSGESAIKKMRLVSDTPDIGSDTLPEKMKLRIKALEVENEELRRQLHESRQAPTHAGYTGIPGVEVVGEQELVVTNEAMSFQWKDHGFKLHIPEDTLPKGVSKYSVNIKASLSGLFELPRGYELVSAVYWVTAPGKFTKPVTIEAQHCANFNRPSQLRFVQSAQKALPYKFEVIDGGSFSLGSKYGVLSTTHFSGAGIAKKVKSGEHSCQYCAQVYFTVKHLQNHWYYCHFVVTKDLEMCLTMVRRKYQQECDIAPPITFGADHVALGIPDDGTRTDSGWEIVPVQRTQIEKDRVDNFSSETTWVPECVLLLKWLRNDRNPNPLVYRVNLVGTGRENDFFRIVHHPDIGLSLPAPLVVEHQNIQPAAEENPVENPQVELRTTSEQRTKDPFPKCPLFGGSTVQPAAVVNPVENHQVELTLDDLIDVTNYLLDLGTTHIYNLGLTFGLNQPHVRSMRDSPSFRDDVIAAWLQREDQVTRRGVPTWRTLVRALRDRRVNQTGVADTIAAERGVI